MGTDSAIGADDRATLRRLVGAATFVRGELYARRGAVRSRTVDGAEVVGEVQGEAARPYRTSVRLLRAGRRLSGIEATCSCPVGIDCKHAVALVLAEEVAARPEPPALTLIGRDRRRSDRDGGSDGGPGGEDDAGADATSAVTVQLRDGVLPALRPAGDGAGVRRAEPVRSPTVRPAAPDWRHSLDAVVAGDDGAGDTALPLLGLQFEVTTRPRLGGRPGGPGIRVRPVVPGASGQWVRTGTSWAAVDRLSAGRSGRERAAAVMTVKELLALSRLAGFRSTYAYSYGDEAVWLEALDSRRLWDLLRQARDLGIPLLGVGRKAAPVRLVPSVATAEVEVTRVDGGLKLRPAVRVDGALLGPPSTSLLIGSPAHGIAWWDTDAPAKAPLCLAPLAAPVDEALAGLLRTPSIEVPGGEEGYFLRRIAPTLGRKVRLHSGDGSVDLPRSEPAALVLDVVPVGTHRLRLTWSRRRAGGTLAPLWETGPRAAGGDRLAEDAIAALAVDVVARMPELVETTGFGERLAPSADLGAMAAVRFVTTILPDLQATPGVVVLGAETVPAYREADAAPVVALGGSGQGDWFDLTVSVTVGGEDVPFGELFTALAEGQTHMILPSGTYFPLDQPDVVRLSELITEARSLSESRGEAVRIGRFQAGLWDELTQLGVVGAQAAAWEASVQALLSAGERTEHPVPPGLLADLRPYQRSGFNWLAYLHEHGLGGILADDMGLGKTLQALALICHVRAAGDTPPFLVVAPTSVVSNWASECERFAPGLRTVAIAETATRRGSDLADAVTGADVVVTSYALFRLEYDRYAAISWAGLFLDEAQFAKNRASQAYQRAKALPVAYKVAMTGTPMENNLMELWSLLSITAPGLFPSPERFAERYRVPIERQGDEERLAALRRRIRPLMLRRTKDQVVADLPAKQEQVLELDLDPRHKKLYDMYLQRERQKVLGLLGDMTKNRFEIFRSLTLLRQASLAIALVDPDHPEVPSTKLDALAAMLDDIVADGHRVLVFSQFTRFLTLARERAEAAGIEHCYLDGRTRDRGSVIADFRAGKAPVFFISLKAGGFGLNLTEADYCVLLDPWWNPATEAQAVDRIHRIGQTRKVMVYRFVARDTLEEKVMALKARKAALFANVLDAGGLESGALSAEDIRSLVS
jgi:superfamily II DNA or RNA helicase